MSGKGGGGNNGGKGSNGLSGIPAASRKMVQSLKEIVNNCTEQEIYATLVECNMDADEAVNRLFSQDPFHEVKKKREKKKENKDTSDSRPRAANNRTNRSSKGITDHYAGYGGSSESGVLQSNFPSKKENGTYGHAGSSSSGYGMVGNSMNQQASSRRGTVATEDNVLTSGIGDGISLSLQPSSGYQSAWSGVPGQLSMADIVKMRRPQSKTSATHNPPIHTDRHQNVANFSHQGWQASPEHGTSSQHFPPTDEWPMIEPSPATHITVAESATGLEMYSDPSSLPLDGTNQHIDSPDDMNHEVEDGRLETINENVNHIRPSSMSGGSLEDDGSGHTSVFDSNLYKDTSSYQPHAHGFESNEGELNTNMVQPVSANLQQLTLHNEEESSLSEEDNPSVVIPDHLQLHTPDCFHLSFGSFGAGTVPFSSSGSFSSAALKSNVEELSVQADVQSIGHSESRNSEYYGDEHLRTTLEENLMHRTAASAEIYDSSTTKPEGIKQEIHEETQTDQYVFPSAAPRFPYESNNQSNAQFTHQQMNSQMQNFTNFHNAYSSSLPSTLLASNVQTVRDDFPYSPFPGAQSMATKYSDAASITGPTISMTEALRASNIQNPQLAAQTLPSAGLATGPTLQQHLAVHPYSQPTLPVGHFANMIGYPFLPQSYTYMPSAFQQAFAGNSTYHQSLAAMLPQYKSSVSASSLPQSAAIAGFGNSATIPGANYPVNLPTAPTGTPVGYDDVISSQYKDNSHLMSLQQNDNPAMWLHGHGSRTISSVPASTYYGYQQGQNQQPATFRQAQQASEHYGALGYPNFYHSQAGISLENHQQQQNQRDQSLNSSSQGQTQTQTQKQQSQAQLIWQNSY